MGTLQSHVLLHPTRMRVMVAIGSDALTTREIQSRLPDIAQASLYRAVSRLEQGGALQVVERRRKGGAVERVYRAVRQEEYQPGPPVRDAARAEAFAAVLAADARRAVASGGSIQLRHVELDLAPDHEAELREAIWRLVDEAAAHDRGGDPRVMLALAIGETPEPPRS